MIAIGLMLICSPVALYFIRPDSANGRLLIWRICWEMIKCKPWFGFGRNGFMANYMNFQAEWLYEHNNSSWSILADNVKSPFNEFISIIVEYGFVGLSIAIILIGLLLYCVKNGLQDKTTKMALLSTLSIFIVGFFSYPLHYAIALELMIMNITVILRNTPIICRLFYDNLAKCFCALSMLVLSIVIIAGLIIRTPAIVDWTALMRNQKSPASAEQVAKYAALEPSLHNNPYFMYNYSATLYAAGLYEICLEKSIKSLDLWADYDTEILTANCYENLGNTVKAEEHYLHSSKMCPNRFYPLYCLMNLYKNEGREKEFRNIVNTIHNMPVKTESEEVIQIRTEANGYYYGFIKTFDN